MKRNEVGPGTVLILVEGNRYLVGDPEVRIWNINTTFKIP